MGANYFIYMYVFAIMCIFLANYFNLGHQEHIRPLWLCSFGLQYLCIYTFLSLLFYLQGYFVYAAPWLHGHIAFVVVLFTPFFVFSPFSFVFFTFISVLFCPALLFLSLFSFILQLLLQCLFAHFGQRAIFV